MTVRINRKLHLVIPIEQGDKTLYAHATPVETEVFDTYFLPIAKTFSSIYTEGLGAVAGPRVAAKMLKQVSEALGQWDDVKQGFMAEIRRLCNVFAPTDSGWSMIPLEEAISKKIIDKGDASEVENAIVFFTLTWLMHKKTDRERIISDAAGLWGARIESLNCTEFRDSLQMLIAKDNSGKAAA